MVAQIKQGDHATWAITPHVYLMVFRGNLRYREPFLFKAAPFVDQVRPPCDADARSVAVPGRRLPRPRVLNYELWKMALRTHDRL